MTKIRSMQQLNDQTMREWSREELEHHHQLLSDVSPWLNAQGVSIHHQIIEEMESRGGISGGF